MVQRRILVQHAAPGTEDVRATFPIDEETGRTLTLLVLARQSLRSCVPATAERIERALPPDLRGLPAPAP